MSQDTSELDLTSFDEEKTLKLASDIASVNLLFAQRELGRRIVDPNVTTRALLDIAEHSFKVSGMAKKQEPKLVGERFSITINIPQIGTKPPETLVIEASEPGHAEDSYSANVLCKEAVGLIDWASVPEFS